MRVALTFDDGPSAWTGEILDLLAEHEAKATFFVCGHAVAAHRDRVARAVREGHEVGNHTWNHKRPTEITNQDLLAELTATNEAIRLAAGTEPKHWRAPHGATDTRTDRVGRVAGLSHVGWTVDPGDWLHASGERIATEVLARLEDGAIVDLHDGIPPGGGNGTNTRRHTVEAVGLILNAGTGARFVTVSEL